jgi:hypothetical protein
LTPWQEILDAKEVLSAKLTVAGESVAKIATACGVTPETVRMWHRRPAWQSARDHLQAEADEILRNQTRLGAGESIEYLRQVVCDDSNKYKDSFKLQCASRILQHERSYRAQLLELTGARGGPIRTEAEVVPGDALSAAEKLVQRLGLPQAAQGSAEQG